MPVLFGVRNGPNSDSRRYSQIALSAFLVLTFGVGLAVIGGYAAQVVTLSDWLSLSGVGLVVGAAAWLVGGLLGFVFGIPRSAQQEVSANQSASGYAPNTNLEQIS